jgi:hypothetical protein
MRFQTCLGLDDLIFQCDRATSLVAVVPSVKCCRQDTDLGQENRQQQAKGSDKFSEPLPRAGRRRIVLENNPATLP